MKSPIKIISVVTLCLAAVPSYATVYDLDVAVQNVRDNCLGIGSKLGHLKTLAGVSTGVNAVGTAVGAGALAAGIVKANKDKEAEDIIDKIVKKLQVVPANVKLATKEELLADYEAAWKEDEAANKVASGNGMPEETKKLLDEKKKLEQESKTLGNVRTGLLATNTATQVAGAVLSSQTKASGDLKEQINKCIAAADDLKESMNQARLEGKDTTQVKRIVDACSEYKYADLSKINNLATGATVTSSIGAVAGGVGTITSAVANTDSTRNDNTKAGKEKEKNLNTASNVLSGVSTATSAVSTVLNGVHIATIKKVVSTADNCEKELR